jgi:hypothetical protein
MTLPNLAIEFFPSSHSSEAGEDSHSQIGTGLAWRILLVRVIAIAPNSNDLRQDTLGVSPPKPVMLSLTLARAVH